MTPPPGTPLLRVYAFAHKKGNRYIYTHTHTHMCVCVCVYFKQEINSQWYSWNFRQQQEREKEILELGFSTWFLKSTSSR